MFFINNEEKNIFVPMLEKMEWQELTMDWIDTSSVEYFGEVVRRYDMIQHRKLQSLQNGGAFLKTMESYRYGSESETSVTFNNLIKVCAQIYLGGGIGTLDIGGIEYGYKSGRVVRINRSSNLNIMFTSIKAYTTEKIVVKYLWNSPGLLRKYMKRKSLGGKKFYSDGVGLCIAECLRHPSMVVYWMMILHLLKHEKINAEDILKYYPPAYSGSEKDLHTLKQETFNIIDNKRVGKRKISDNLQIRMKDCLTEYIKSAIMTTERKKYVFFEGHVPKITKEMTVDHVSMITQWIIHRKIMRFIFV